MQIIYQGKSLETSAAFLAAFLAEKGIYPRAKRGRRRHGRSRFFYNMH